MTEETGRGRLRQLGEREKGGRGAQYGEDYRLIRGRKERSRATLKGGEWRRGKEREVECGNSLIERRETTGIAFLACAAVFLAS